MRTALTISILSLTSIASAQWSQAAPATSPSPRIEAQMAFDSTASRTLLFGGADNGGFPPQNFADTWSWDGANWTQQSPANSPSGRYFGGMAYDVVRDVTVLYGGLSATFFGANYKDDTWEWDGTNWSQVPTANSPGSYLGNPGMGELSMAYDLIGQRTVVFGGELFQGIVPAPAVTFEYDGIDWAQVATGTQPPPRSQASLCSAPTLGGVLLFGGTNFNNPPGPNGEITWNDTWVYSSMTHTWTQIVPAGDVPSARAGASLLFDARLGLYVMHGGYESTPTALIPLSDTWVFDGANWTEVTQSWGSPTSPRLRFAQAEGPGANVSFGGSTGVFGTLNNETWLQGAGAAASAYGNGCVGGFGAPTLTPSNVPQLGTTFNMAAANLDPAAVLALMTIGFSRTNSNLGPLPLSLQQYGLGAGCDLLSSGDVTTLFGASAGAGTFAFVVPASSAFAGLQFFFQGASLDGAATGGVAVTNGVAALLGN